MPIERWNPQHPVPDEAPSPAPAEIPMPGSVPVTPDASVSANAYVPDVAGPARTDLPDEATPDAPVWDALTAAVPDVPMPDPVTTMMPDVPMPDTMTTMVPDVPMPDPVTGRWDAISLPSSLDSADVHEALRVAEPFRLFHAHFGKSLCGAPVSELTAVDGRPVQYFENLALVERDGGRVEPLPIGEAAYLASAPESTGPTPPGPRGAHAVDDLTGKLPRHPQLRYPQRPLAQIRHLVLHHTATSTAVGPFEVAAEHVEVNRWPGIGYHFFVGADGRISRTQDLGVETFHARQFNPAAVGIALAGDYTSAVPPPAQLDAVADLMADLVRDLGLPLSSIRGHREVVSTPCPGETFLTLWKPRLVRLVEARLAVEPARSGPIV